MDKNTPLALITGASHGVGRACAFRFARDGFSLALADIDESALEGVANEVTALGVDVVWRRTDVSSQHDIDDLFNAIRKEFGRVDVLVNSAGVRPIGSIIKVTPEEWDHVQAVNVRGSFACLQAAVPFMRDQGGGKIINLGSVSGLRGLGNRAPYCTSKAAVHGMTKQAAVELSPLNIQVNAVAPGYTEDTAMTELYTEDVVQVMINSLPPGGRRTRPDEVANAVAFLAAPGSESITGSIIVLDWGLTETVVLDAWPWQTDVDMLPTTKKA
jgi:NAD(P)-dependent dehydrogenase (short-subunit alcohol dehydrogenase family)